MAIFGEATPKASPRASMSPKQHCDMIKSSLRRRQLRRQSDQRLSSESPTVRTARLRNSKAGGGDDEEFLSTEQQSPDRLPVFRGLFGKNLPEGLEQFRQDIANADGQGGVLAEATPKRLADIEQDDSATESDTPDKGRGPPRQSILANNPWDGTLPIGMSATAMFKLIKNMYRTQAESRYEDYHRCLKVQGVLEKYLVEREKTRGQMKSIHRELVEVAATMTSTVASLEKKLDVIAGRIDLLE